MPLFSERLGFIQPRETMQIECANDELRTSIYNIIHMVLGDYSQGSKAEAMCKELWTMKWHNPIDTFPFYSSDFYSELYEQMLDGEWYVCYDLIEFVYNELDSLGMFDPEPTSYGYGGHGWNASNPRKIFQVAINDVLEDEGSGYRFLNEQIVPITNDLEITAIEQSLSADNNLAGASSHIRQSLKLLSKRPEPDYLNSVKESIEAAESAAKKVVSTKANTLADAVDALQKKHCLHKSLAEAWKKMFGYTSDASGIRHAGSDEPIELDFAFAKYMLVTCSAFVNYLAEEFEQDA